MQGHGNRAFNCPSDFCSIFKVERAVSSAAFQARISLENQLLVLITGFEGFFCHTSNALKRALQPYFINFGSNKIG